jgi:CYTH domain-containing protein
MAKKFRKPKPVRVAKVKKMLRQDDSRWAVDKKYERKMHVFLDAWRAHLREELRLHQELLKSKNQKTLDMHVARAAAHHAAFVKKLNNL